MKSRTKFSSVLAGLAVVLVATPAVSQQIPVSEHMTGYEETPLTLNTTGDADFKAVVSADGTSIQYMMSYRNLSTPLTQSHIHFGRPGLTGGVVLFLCTNLTPPAGVPMPQACPLFPATISGTLTAADVISVPGQGIDAGAAGFAQMVSAIKTGSAYANIHTTKNPGGEIRARLLPLLVAPDGTSTN